MKIKAGQQKKLRTQKTSIILKMSEGKQIFFDLVAKVEQLGVFHEILFSELPKYQITPNKCQWLDTKTISNIYENIQLKQRTIQQPIGDFQTWNDNQKKVFVWFVIFHRYFLQKEGGQINEESWPLFSKVFFNRNARFLHFHYLNLLKPEGKITWTPQEDALLTEAVENCEEGKWNEVSKYYFFKSNFQMFKCSKHCRERWLNHLDEKKKHGNWTPQEDLVIFNFVTEVGKKWSKLVPILNETRTEHMIKNRFNSLMTKLRGNSKKEKEDHVIQKVIKHIKKQLANHERRKQRKDQQKEVNQEVVPEKIKQEDRHDTPETIQKRSLPSSQDSTVKKEDSQIKTYLVHESEEKEERSEIQENVQQNMVPMQSYPIAMDPYMCGQYTAWYPQPIMPYMIPYGYYPRTF